MKRFITMLLLPHLAIYMSVGQVVISMQDFDQVSTMTYTYSGGTLVTGNSGTGDRPANSAFYVSPVTAYGISNGTASIEFSDITGLGNYTSKYFEFRLASWSINSTSNGADAADSVTASVSLDGGITWSREVQVGGNNNACWHYSTGTGLASVPYDGNNVPQVFAPAGGGNRTTDGYSTVRILLADAVMQARLRIFLRNNHASELWTIDEVKLTGTPSVPVPTLTVIPGSLSGFTYMTGFGPSPSQTYTLSGTDLTPSSGSVTATGPADYELSPDNLSFGATVIIPYTGGALASTTLWVRLKAGLAAGSYNEIINHSGGGAATAGLSCNGTVVPAPAIYSWTGPDGGDWQVPGNWFPVRSAPAPDDILQFHDGSTKTIINIPSQAIGQLMVSGSTTVSLECTGASLLTITGNAGEDLMVDQGSQLNFTGVDALKMVLDTGTTGRVQGTVLFDEGAHRMMASDDSSLVFLTGSVFSAGASFSGAPFGNTTANKNTILFTAGSTYISQGGSNPFGLSYPNSVVIFAEGSLYRHEQSGSLSLSGRTYAGFELDYPSSFSPTGGNPCTMEDLTISQGILNILLTAPDFNITGDISVAGGQVLNFNPASAININLEGASQQSISGEGDLLVNNLSTLVISNQDGVLLDKDASIDGNLDITVGKFTILPGQSLTVSGNTILESSNCLWIASDSSGTGSLIDNGIEGSGTAMAELRLDSGAWHFACIPMTSALTTVFTGSYATWFNEPENHFQYIISSDSVLSTQLFGYSIMPPDSSVTAKFSGDLNTGDLSIGVSRTFIPEGLDDFNGYNLVGNPYVSAVDLAPAMTGWVNVDPTAWFWDACAGNYKVYPGGAPQAGTHSQFVPAMQGFFVHCNDTNATQAVPGSGQVTFTNEARVHQNEPFLKDPSLDQDLLRVSSVTDQNSFSDELTVYFSDALTAGYLPGQDAEKMSGDPEAPQLYTTCPGHHLTVNGQPLTDQGIAVPMGFSMEIAGSITLTTTGAESFEPDISVTLEDLKENYSQDLKTLPDYSFDYIPGEDPGRFILHFSKPNISNGSRSGPAVPVIFSSGGEICLDWRGIRTNPGDLSLYDLTGRRVFSRRMQGSGREQFSAGVSTGYYILSLETEQGIVYRKFYLP